MRVGTITFDTAQGIANIALAFHKAGLVQRAMVFRHRAYANLDRWPHDVRYQPTEVDQFLQGLDALLLVETDLTHDWMLSRLAKQRGVKVVLIPMYEYTQFPPPVRPDLVICPSALDYDYWSPTYDCVQLPLPVEQSWRLRERALEFVHNAGHGQHDYAKGTVQVIDALQHVQAPIKLRIRAQLDDGKMRRLYEQHRHHPRLEWELDVPPERLYAVGDVFINTEKFNGCSLPLQEAWASGMCVVTTDRYPANTWLPPEPLIPVKEYVRYRIPGGSGIEFDKAVVDPVDVARVIDGLYGEDISRFSLAGRDYAAAHSWETLKPRYTRAIEEAL